MCTSTPITAVKTEREEYIECLKKYCTTTVDHKSKEDCIICTDRLCDTDGCTVDAHEEPVRLQCGHVIGSRCAAQWFQESQQCPLCRRVLFEAPKSYYF